MSLLAQSEIYAVMALRKSRTFRMPHFLDLPVITRFNGHTSSQGLMVAWRAYQIYL